MNMVKVDFRTNHMPATDAMRAHVERRVRAALGRHPDVVARATLRVRDINGPRGGSDLQCSLLIEGPRFGRLIGQVTHDDFYAGTTEVIRKVAHALDLDIRRRRRLFGGFSDPRAEV
jgi:putative sigma-54 modulation protein